MRKNSENMLTAIARAPWWVGFSFAAILLIMGQVVKSMQFGLFPLGLAFSMVFKMFAAMAFIGGFVSLLRAMMNGQLFAKVGGLDDIKAMSWQEFEFLVGEYYRRKGYSVFQMGGDSPDGGIDLFAQKDGGKLVIQCKHWKAYKVDVKVVRELYGVMVDATASGAVLMTSGGFTPPAEDFAKDKPIELIDGAKLAKLIADAKAPTAAPAKSRATLIPTEPPPLCPHCKVPMVMRTAQKGPNPGAKFWGCANYPACRHTVAY